MALQERRAGRRSGVSGDGVDQNDVVTFLAAQGFLPDGVTTQRADQVASTGPAAVPPSSTATRSADLIVRSGPEDQPAGWNRLTQFTDPQNRLLVTVPGNCTPEPLLHRPVPGPIG